MTKYKVGDRVVYNGSGGYLNGPERGALGSVVGLSQYGLAVVKYPDIKGDPTKTKKFGPGIWVVNDSKLLPGYKPTGEVLYG